MNVDEGAVCKVAAIKFFVRNVYIRKNESAGIEAYNFFVLFYVVINVFFCLARIWNVVETVVLFVGNAAVFIKG